MCAGRCGSKGRTGSVSRQEGKSRAISSLQNDPSMLAYRAWLWYAPQPMETNRMTAPSPGVLNLSLSPHRLEREASRCRSLPPIGDT